MRVLHVAECIGGVDRYLRMLLKYSNCENIVVLSQLYNRNDYEHLADSVEIMQIEHNINFNAIKEAYQLRKVIKKYKPDIVYAHSSIAGAITRMACLFLHTKVIYNPHGWSFNMDDRNNKIYIILEKIMSHFCDAIICISNSEKKAAIQKKICKSNKLHVIYNGVDIKEYSKEKNNSLFPSEKFVVGMVGRICKQKAPDIFVKMANEIQHFIKNTCFIIVGDVIEGSDSEKEQIIAMAKQYDIDLIITGWVNNPLDYIKNFDVGCLFSRWEGFGLVIPEYMLMGVPIVATKVDAIPYLINDKENGLLIEKDDWKNAAKKVIEIKNNNNLREHLINNGFKTVQNKFNAQRVAIECEKLYKELIK